MRANPIVSLSNIRNARQSTIPGLRNPPNPFSPDARSGRKSKLFKGAGLSAFDEDDEDDEDDGSSHKFSLTAVPVLPLPSPSSSSSLNDPRRPTRVAGGLAFAAGAKSDLISPQRKAARASVAAINPLSAGNPLSSNRRQSSRPTPTGGIELSPSPRR